MKNLLTTISVLSLLAITPALAQTGSQPGPTAPPAKSAPPSNMPDKSEPMPDKSAPKAAPSARSDLPAAKLAPASMGKNRASNLLNASMKNAAGENVGNISDLLIDDSGKITSVIIGVGGFLGIGERNVALSFEQVQISRDANNRLTVTSNVTKESLKAVPEWKDPNTSPTSR